MAERHSPSVIARLMGLNELPPQQGTRRQQRVLSENYLQKTASIGLRENSSFSSRTSTRKRKSQKHEFEIKTGQASKDEAQLVSHNAVIFVAEDGVMGLQRQVVAEFKNISTVKQFYQPKSRHIVLESIHSTSNISSTYVQTIQPVPTKCPTALKLFSAVDNRKNYTKSDKSANLRPPQGLEIDSNMSPSGGCDIHLDKLKLQWPTNDKISHSSTRIVVLKPRVGKMHRLQEDILLPRSHSGDYQGILPSEYAEIGDGVMEAAKTTDVEPRRPSFRIKGGTAERNIQQVRRNITSNNSALQEPKRPLEGLSKSEVSEAFCPITRDDKVQEKSSSSRASGLYLASEAKKQIFERWKMTKDFQEVEVARRKHTLGEMLAMSDVQKALRKDRSKIDKASECHPLGRKMDTPFGSSTRTRSEAFHNDWCLGREQFVGLEEEKFSNGRFSEKNILEHEESGSDHEKQKSYISGNSDKNQNAVRDFVTHQLSGCTLAALASKCGNPSQGDSEIKEKKVMKSRKMKLNADSGCRAGYSDSFTQSCLLSKSEDLLSDPKTGKDHTASKNFKEQQSKVRPSLTSEKDFDISGHFLEASGEQEDGIKPPEECVHSSRSMIDPEYSVKLTEANQTSPDSVLEPLFGELSVPTSVCHIGLAEELQHLETKSEERYSEGSEMAVSSDEDTDERYVDFFQDGPIVCGSLRSEESKKFSYLVDILDEADFTGMNPDLTFETWNYQRGFVKPLIFEALEKKYGKQISWSRSERRLLFDCVNSGLKEISDSFTQGKSIKRFLRSSLKRDELEEELWNLLVTQENGANKDVSRKALETEPKWMDLDEDIHDICSEVESFLFDELVAELGNI